jgi:protein tyrosine phosphatase (PTP) superfamily phosphohydrolase (DUF442 family)
MSLRDVLPDLPNASTPLPWLVVSGQPSESALQAVKDAGIDRIIDMRDPMEPRGYDEPETARRLGLQYDNAPVAGEASDEVMDRALEALRRDAGNPTLLHCNSANRTGGPLRAYLMIDEGMDEAAAIDAALRSGLRDAGLLEWAVDYARRHRKPPTG